MLKVNGIHIEQGKFPDKTPLLHLSPSELALEDGCFDIMWLYDDMGEFVNLSFLVMKIREEVPDADIRLICPYIPNARMDRAQNPDDVFTLKYFAQMLNMLGFSEIVAHDVHSIVSTELLSNLNDLDVKPEIKRVLKDLDDVSIFFPDEGACKRYADLVSDRPIAYGRKRRDWATGRILGLDICGMDEGGIANHDFLIVDDICSKGGTFYHSALKLKELGASRCYLYVTHCENTIQEGQLLAGNEIGHIYTTDSIYTLDEPKVSVIRRWGRQV